MILCDTCSPSKQCTAEKNRTECRFYQPMTNEEWLCQLSTEEKATFLASNKMLNFDYQMWLEWLKEKHNEM